MIPQYAAADYLAAFLADLPRGRAWPRWPGSVLSTVCAALVAVYARHNSRAVALVVDAFPTTTLELLPEWEATLGLPGQCDLGPQTLQQRQRAVASRFVASGGQSIPYFTAVAAALGYDITVTEFASFVAGRGRAGTPCGDAFANAWQINAPGYTVLNFRAGASTAGEPLASWGNTTLQCVMRSLAPAHTTVLFAYSTGTEGAGGTGGPGGPTTTTTLGVFQLGVSQLA